MLKQLYLGGFVGIGVNVLKIFQKFFELSNKPTVYIVNKMLE